MEFLTRLRGKNGELVLPTPSPGDRLLEDGILVLDVPPSPPPPDAP